MLIKRRIKELFDRFRSFRFLAFALGVLVIWGVESAARLSLSLLLEALIVSLSRGDKHHASQWAAPRPIHWLVSKQRVLVVRVLRAHAVLAADVWTCDLCTRR